MPLERKFVPMPQFAYDGRPAGQPTSPTPDPDQTPQVPPSRTPYGCPPEGYGNPQWDITGDSEPADLSPAIYRPKTKK